MLKHKMEKLSPLTTVLPQRTLPSISMTVLFTTLPQEPRYSQTVDALSVESILTSKISLSLRMRPLGPSFQLPQPQRLHTTALSQPMELKSTNMMASFIIAPLERHNLMTLDALLEEPILPSDLPTRLLLNKLETRLLILPLKQRMLPSQLILRSLLPHTTALAPQIQQSTSMMG